MTRRFRLGGAPLIILACLFWSFSGVLGKTVAFHPLTLTGFRAVIASVMLGAARKSYRLGFGKGTMLGAWGVALTSLLFMYANRLTTAANAIVLQYAMPIFVILLTWLIFRQKPTRLDAVCAAFVLSGVLLCFVEGLGGGHLVGDALGLLSAVTWAMVFFAARMPNTDALSYTYMGNLISSLLVLNAPFDTNFSLAAGQLLPAAAMGICLGMGYLLFSLGMRKGVSPIAAAILANVEPVMNPTWVFLFAGEFPGVWSIVGALVVLSSVTVYSILKNRK